MYNMRIVTIVTNLLLTNLDNPLYARDLKEPFDLFIFDHYIMCLRSH